MLTGISAAQEDGVGVVKAKRPPLHIVVKAGLDLAENHSSGFSSGGSPLQRSNSRHQLLMDHTSAFQPKLPTRCLLTQHYLAHLPRSWHTFKIQDFEYKRISFLSQCQMF